MKSILILSPHPDDAVLSCSDHILSWKKKGYLITICTIFSNYSKFSNSNAAKKFISQSGCNSTEELQTKRGEEDLKAAKFLNVNRISPQFTDALFRTRNKKNIYPTFDHIFNGKVSGLDLNVVENVNVYLSRIAKQFDQVFAPLGIGNHVDHSIVQNCARNSFESKKLYYYLDAPYFLQVSHWNGSFIKKVISHFISIKVTTHRKRQAISIYSSQQQILFQQFPAIFFNGSYQLYPEIIISSETSTQTI